MKKFETPEIEVVTFAVEDVITTSIGDSGNLGKDELPMG